MALERHDISTPPAVSGVGDPGGKFNFPAATTRHSAKKMADR